VSLRTPLLLLAASLGVVGCDLSMQKQGKYKTESPAPLFADDTSAQAPPDHTVAQGAETPAQAAAPPPVTPALLARGRERHEIFCQPCHGPAGEGDGTIVGRGFPRPPTYQDPRARQASAAELYGAITNGYGVMFPYAERIPPADRWAIVAYIRALQTAHDLKTAGGRS
jgi:mono/diheme cytochrome c family protein